MTEKMCETIAGPSTQEFLACVSYSPVRGGLSIALALLAVVIFAGVVRNAIKAR